MVQLIFTNYHCVTGLAPRRFICFDGISSPDCKKLGVARIEPTTAKYCDDDGVLWLDGCQQGGGGAAGVGPLHVAVLYGYQQSPSFSWSPAVRLAWYQRTVYHEN